MPRQGIAPAPRRTAAGTWTPRGKGRHRFQASFRRASICAFWKLGFRQSGFRHIARAARPVAPYAWARPAGFLACYGPYLLTDPGKPSGPRTPPPVRARSAGDTGSAPRGAPMSSIESAPAAMPATRQPSFSGAFAPHSPPGRTRSARSPAQAGPLREGHHGHQAAVRHEVRVIERGTGPRGVFDNLTCEVSSRHGRRQRRELPSSQFRGHLSRCHARNHH